MDIFRIPNVGDVPTYPMQARVYDLHWKLLAMAATNGVVSGCEVTESGTPALTVEVASGRAVANGVGFDVDGGTVIITTPNATNPRWDLIVSETDGDVKAYAGTAATSPVPPVPSTIGLGTEVALALVFVPANDTAIVDAQITSLAVPIPEPLGAAGWTTLTASDQATSGTRSNTATLAADSQLLFAMAANTVYRVRGHIDWLTGATTSGVKYGFSLPASPTSVRVRIMRDGSVAGSDYTTQTWRKHTAAETTGVSVSTGAARLVSIDIDGEVHNGANTGNFALTWAQVAAIAENTVRYNGSYLEYAAV